MSKRLLTVSLALAVASTLIFIPLTAGGQEGRSEGAQQGTPAPSNDGGATVESGDWDGDGPRPRDFVISDDLIVDGSACVGFDCVNGETFGFDTIRIKENNLRINAVDTSTSASFPTQDWMLVFNDSNNGGANRFSVEAISPASGIPFTIEAGSGSHHLYVDDGGRIGFGTNSPVVELHVVDGDTPTLRLEQDGSSGFTPQTWDVAGNETNFFIRDATGGSKLPFRIRPGAPGNSIFVDNNGEVGFGTTSPDATIDISGTAPTFQLTDTNSTGSNSSWQFETNGVGDLALRDGADQVALRVNDDGIFRITPRASAPAGTGGEAPVNGDIYVNTNGTVCIRVSGSWLAVLVDDAAAGVNPQVTGTGTC